MIEAFEVASNRLESRLDDLTDQEFFWSMSPDWRSVRQDLTGAWVLDGERPGSQPASLTTIAWRLSHLGGPVFGGFSRWLATGASPFEDDHAVPPTANAARFLYQRNYQRWHSTLVSCSDSRLIDPLGDRFGECATKSGLDLCFHVLDELIHHGAEIALLRDLYEHHGCNSRL